MYNTSTAYKEEIKKPSRSFECKVTIGDRIFYNDDIVDIITDGNIQPQEGFSIGNTVSQALDLTLLNKGDTIYSTNQIKLEIGLNIGSNTEYILMGYYNIDDVEKTDYTIKFTAFDNMIKFETAYFSSLGDSPTLQQVVNELATKTGVQFIGSLPSYTVKKLEGFTCREILSYAASLCGGNAVITRDGKFTIVYPKDINYSITADNYIDYKREEVKYKIGKVTCEIKEKETISKGSLGTDSMELLFENPWINETILTDIFNRLNGFEYLGYNMKWQGDLSLDVGDIITCTDVKGVVRKLPILSQKLTYTGGLTSEIGAKGESKNKNTFSSSGSMGNKVDRMVTEVALINKAFIDYAHINDADIVNLKAQTAKIQVIEAEAASINNLLAGNLTAKNMQTGFITAESGLIANSAISSAQIISLDVSKINAGNISTNKFVVTSDSGNLKIEGNTLKVWDTAGKERVSLGLNGTDYNLLVRGADGVTTLFGSTGITNAGITNGAVDDSKVAANANINGSKIEKETLVAQINGATTTLKASKIKLDTEAQTLDLAFTSLKSTVTTQGNTISSQGTAISTVQGQISSKIWQQDITTAINPVSGKVTTLESNYSTINQQVSGITTDVNSLKTTTTNLSTTVNSQSSQISQLSGEISAKVSESQLTEAIKGMQGSNLLLDSGTKVTNSNYLIKKYIMTENMIEGESYTLRIKGTLGAGKTNFGAWLDGGSIGLGTLTNEGNGYHTVKFKGKKGTLNPSEIHVYVVPSSVVVSSTIECIKLEKGSKPTDWTVAPEDIETRVAGAEVKLQPGNLTSTVFSNVSSTQTVTVEEKCTSSSVEYNLRLQPSYENTAKDQIVSLEDQGAYAQLTFTGTAVEVWTSKTNDSCICEIFLDGVSKGKIDLYSSPFVSKAKIYSISGLSNSSHTIKVVNTGTKSASSVGYWLNFHKFLYTTTNKVLTSDSMGSILQQLPDSIMAGFNKINATKIHITPNDVSFHRTAFWIWDETDKIFTVAKDGYGNYGLEVGSKTMLKDSYVDFNCGRGNDFDARIIASGGQWGTNGRAGLIFYGSRLYLNNFGSGSPADNSYILTAPNMNRLNFVYSGSTGYMELAVIDGGAWGLTAWQSDVRLKNSIADTEINALEKVMAIKHRQFNFNRNNSHVDIGYIAQELQQIHPALVFGVKQEDGSELLNPQTSVIIPLISKAVQELKEEKDREILELRQEIELLKELIKAR